MKEPALQIIHRPKTCVCVCVRAREDCVLYFCIVIFLLCLDWYQSLK